MPSSRFRFLGVTFGGSGLNRTFCKTGRVTTFGTILLTAAFAAADPAALPDAPDAQQTDTNAHTPASAPSLVASPPAAPIGQLGVSGKFSFYVKSEFAPATLVVPGFTALYRMANPIDNYPRQWEDGGGAFGRNYGSGLASAFSEKTATFITGVVLHEDPRYFPSENRAFGARVFHAARFTLIDKGDSGHSRPAISNFAGAFAGGFIGNAYLPPGYRDAPHAEQRSLIVLAFMGAGNEASEFRPEIRTVLKKMHVPFVK